jgi:hypothetical protein
MFNWIADDVSAVLSSDGVHRRGRTRQDIAA